MTPEQKQVLFENTGRAMGDAPHEVRHSAHRSMRGAGAERTSRSRLPAVSSVGVGLAGIT